MVTGKSIPRMFFVLLIVTMLIGSVAFPYPARAAASIVVNSNADTIANDGACTLREAITTANNDSQLYATAGECSAGSGADTISFAANYTITLVGGQLPAVTTTITINGNGEANTIVQASTCNPVTLPGGCTPANYRVFEVGVAGNLTLNSLTVRNGHCSSCATITFIGGGVYNAGTLTASNVTISANSVIDSGGGMFNDTNSSATLTNVTFSGNSAGWGGGMYSISSSATLTNVTFSANFADQESGGMYNYLANPTLTNVTFSGNSAANYGGGMKNYNSNPTLMNVTFSGNSAMSGGGMYNHLANPTLTNVTFSSNSATWYGGGMENDISLPTLTDVTFSANAAGSSGGGMHNFNNSSPTLTNVIIANSVSGGDCVNDIAVSLNPASSNNLIEDVANTCGLTNATNGNIIGSDPMLGALANNGGFTQTMALGAGSPAIDAGGDAKCPSTDQRGVTRPQGSHCDIGAYELDMPQVKTITRIDANPTSLTSVKFTVIFSEPVTGVDTVAPFNDFALTTGSGISGASIMSVSGSGASYTVTVNTGTGYGTIRLDVVDDNSIVDGTGNPLGGLTVGDGNFATGEVYTVDKTGGDTTGVFRPSNGVIFLKNANTTGFADININYGMGGDYPIVGDWDGDGKDTIGVYRNGIFYLRNSNTVGFADISFAFGTPGDQPIAGDWNGDGIDTVGVFHGATVTFYLRNQNTAGAPDTSFQLGLPGDVGIAGDWNGDGKDTTGVFRPANGIIFLKNTNTTGFADVALNYGIPGDQPVTGDWDGNGTDTIGVFRNGQFFLRNSNTVGYADLVFALGFPTDMPIAGNWDGQP